MNDQPAADSVEPCGEPAVEGQQTEKAPDLQAQLEAAATERADLQDRLLRRQAEFENFRRRSEREKVEIREFAAMSAVDALLPILDDFERALSTECADGEYAKGIELIYQRLRDGLLKLGLKPIEALGQAFDPYVHHAVETVATSDADDHSVIEELQKGYNFRGKLLRPAMVKVAVAPSSGDTPSEARE